MSFSIHKIELKRGETPEMFDKYPYEKIAWDQETKQWVFGGDVAWNPNRPTFDGVIEILGPATPESENPRPTLDQGDSQPSVN